MNTNWIVVHKHGGRRQAYGYARHAGPPKTFLTLGTRVARMTEADAKSLASKLAAEFPSWGWTAMPKEDF